MRTGKIERKTNETEIYLELNLDGKGDSDIKTGCGFLDHMLTLFAAHGNFDLKVSCKGDTDVDFHHTVEDVGICLGDALKTALGDKKGITRYGSKIIPMDEALILSSVDFSGRSLLYFDVSYLTEKVGDFDAELAGEFFAALSRNAEFTLHVVKMAGTNTHHIIEGIFKSVARSIAEAVEISGKNAGKIPSTKGVL